MIQHKNFKVLIAEDNFYDLELAVQELKRAGLIFESKCVDNRPDFIEALDTFKPDIIISDYSMPDFDGISALKIVQESHIDIPFIVITGSLNEEIAVNCIKAGANDYVIKEQLKRLPYSVTEALENLSIRKQKRLTEAALRQSEERFRNLLENVSNIAVQGYAPDGTVKYWNKASETLYGYTKQEAIGKSLYDLIIPSEMIEEVKTNVKLMYDSGITSTSEKLVLKTKDGSAVSVYSNHAIINSAEYGKDLYCIDIDLSQITKAENALIESENKYRKLVENSITGIYKSTIEGNFIFANVALANLLEYNSTQELLSVPVYEIFAHAYKREEFLQVVVEQKSVTNFETILLTSRGVKKNVIINALFDNNEITGMIMDITERKLVEEELKLAKEKAEESDRLKSAFLANLSHEVRTPMNGIIGFAELLLEPEIDDETKKEYVDTIFSNSNQLLKIITDIIEISKIETEQLSVNYHEFSINNLLNDICTQYSNIAQQKSIEFIISNELESQIKVISDEAKIRQSISHLIDNALKFTEYGSVRVSCNVMDSGLHFQVEDTGIGVKPGFEDLIFEPFRQVEDSFSRKYGGNGLGLAISKAYVEVMGGTISLISSSHSGSTFGFSIPLRSRPEPDLQNRLNGLDSIPDYSEYIFLVAEDELTNFAYLEKLLLLSRVRILHAKTGSQALELYQKYPAIHLILMDIKMPEMDGLEATRMIKSLNPQLPVIATTAYAMTGDKELCLAAGCDGYISKPIRKADLYKEIGKFIAQN
ncbi:MAG: response regulator [Lentimicrobiaceae bacterium]|nr:response regulator [Lentimicrobiaceae bacterium]MCB9023301.1 response regulator [Lentimicrobiaceae bacterium]MCO5265709.1 response regulator [Lentimicrobium sp.]